MRAAKDSALSALPVNEEGKIEGFQFGGRARAIAEWRERKEEIEFKKLCRRLKLNKQSRDRFKSDPIWQKYRRAYMAKYMREHYQADVEWRKKYSALALAWKRRRAPVRTCLECGAQWVNVQGIIGHPRRIGRPPTKYCSKRCRVRFKNKELAKRRKGTSYWKNLKRPFRNRARDERRRAVRAALEVTE